MAKENYFGGHGAGEFMWGKGLDVSDKERCGIYRSTDKIVPKFASGGRVDREERMERRDHHKEMEKKKHQEMMERRDNKREKEHKRYASGGNVLDEKEMNMEKRAMKHGGHTERHRDEHGRYATGGAVPPVAYKHGGGILSTMMNLAPLALAAMKKGGHVKHRYDDGGTILLNNPAMKKGGKVKDRYFDGGNIDTANLKKGGKVKDGMFNNPKIHKGGLHESLGIPEGKKIGQKRIHKAEHSRNPLERKQAVLAENMIKAHKHR